MASFKERKNGCVRASVCINSIRDTKVLPNLQKAKNWAREREVELSKMSSGVKDDSRTFGDLFTRYADEVSPKKGGGHWELVRLNMFIKKFTRLCRIRRISEQEIKSLCFRLGYREKGELTFKREFVAVAFLFAIETAMRAGEICSLTRSNIDLKAKVAHLEKTKNGDQRDVPLSPQAVELLQRLPTGEDKDAPVFQLSSASLSTIFRSYRKKTGIEDLTFHDTRHEATTRLADKLHVLELAAVTGHRNLNYFTCVPAEMTFFVIFCWYA